MTAAKAIQAREGAGTSPMPEEAFSADDLVDLARQRSQAERTELFGNITDLFLKENARLSDRERALISGILRKLISQVEMEIRRDLAERLKSRSDAPPELVNLMANDAIEIARPILIESPVLRDPDLIRVIKERGREHWLAITGRRNLSPQVSDAIIESGDADVIESLLSNSDARLSRHAMEYLVAEAERIDRFHGPLVRRRDLPASLAARLYWWVTAALRQHILRNFVFDRSVIDDLMEQATRALVDVAPEQDPSLDTAAQSLVASMAEQGRINPRVVISFFRSGRIPAFVAGLTRLSGAPEPVVRRVTYAGDGESLALLCKLAEFNRNDFGQLYLLLQTAHQGLRPLPAGRLEVMLEFFDDIGVEKTGVVLRDWNRDPQFLAAIDHLAASDPDPSGRV